MNIIKKYYAIKQCQKLDELISIQEDICETLEFGYNLCADFDCIVHYAKVYLKNDKHIQDAGYLNEYKGDKLEAVREIKIGWDCYKNDHKDDVTVIGGKHIFSYVSKEDAYITQESIDEDFQFFWKDYDAYKTRANKIIASFEDRKHDFANLHCIQDLILEYDSHFNFKCFSTKLTEHLCMIRTFKFAQDTISEGHWIKNQWSKKSWILLNGKNEDGKNNMNDVVNKIGSNVEKVRNTISVEKEQDIKPESYSLKQPNVNVKCYRDNGDGTMDWVNCPVIITDGAEDVIVNTTEE